MKVNELLSINEEKDTSEVDGVYKRLLSVSPEVPNAEDEKQIKGDIGRKLKAGWEATELVRYLKNTEEFDADIDETKALNNMKAIKDKVEARLKEKK